MQKFIDPDHPFYRPLWLRLLIVGSCALWTGVEFWNRNDTWGMIFLAVTIYTAATLIVFYKPGKATDDAAAEVLPGADPPTGTSAMAPEGSTDEASPKR